jgi:hypothetical protein
MSMRRIDTITDSIALSLALQVVNNHLQANPDVCVVINKRGIALAKTPPVEDIRSAGTERTL